MDNVITALRERGMIDSMTTVDLAETTKTPLRVYCGFDPTADSLHLGNLVTMMGLAWFQRYGHTPYVLLGGATGMIGDPSGKSTERVLLHDEILIRNLAGITKNFEAIFARDPKLPKPCFLNNYDWFSKFSFIDFLRDVGRHFRVGVMLGKESVRARMQSEEGMSFTEFSYQLLQAYDFFYLYQHHGVTVQIGGADQWGNITAGVDLVRKLSGATVHGFTIPLLMKADGTKFGKSEKGATWLSAEKLAPYEFYQHLVRVDDRDVIKLLRQLTFIDMKDILHLEHTMSQPDYVPNTAQKLLARTVTEFIHGPEGLASALRATEAIMPGKTAQASAGELRALLHEVPSAKMAREKILGGKLIDIIAEAGFLASKGEVRRLIRNGGLTLNGQKIVSEEYQIQNQDIIEDEFLLLSLGKKNKAIIQLEG
jgi:tyrosyl-tRNA synthetase